MLRIFLVSRSAFRSCSVHGALAGSDGDRLTQLETSVRLPTVTGTIDGTAYNTGFFEPLLSPPPEGALPEHLVGDPTIVVASADRVLDVEYGPPLGHPSQGAPRRHPCRAPGRLPAVVDGRPGETSLTQNWTDAYTRGVYNWGGDTVAHWKQRTLDASLAASVRFNIQVEIISHAVMTAIVDPDGADLAQATRALRSSYRRGSAPGSASPTSGAPGQPWWPTDAFHEVAPYRSGSVRRCATACSATRGSTFRSSRWER